MTFALQKRCVFGFPTPASCDTIATLSTLACLAFPTFMRAQDAPWIDLSGVPSQLQGCVAGVTTVQLAFHCHDSPVAVSTRPQRKLRRFLAQMPCMRPSSTGAVGLQAGKGLDVSNLRRWLSGIGLAPIGSQGWTASFDTRGLSSGRAGRSAPRHVGLSESAFSFLCCSNAG